MMKKRLIACGVCLWTAFCMLEARNEKPAVYKDAKAPTEKRVEDLLLRMTMEEKVLQLSQYVAGRNTNANNIGEEVKNIPAEIGALLYYSTSPHLRNNIQKKAMEESRLGIPVLFGHDVIHGFRTVYPISIAQACSWNPALVEKACAMAAREARLAGLDWTFSPMIDVARDPRWGRVSEGYGEDPYTNGVFAVASVKGYQGNNLADGEHIAACLKHYIGYGASEAGRDYVYTEISPQTLWDTYMLPYEMGVKAGAVTLMSGFHDISGVPASANHYTMREVLKGRWSHDGYVFAGLSQMVGGWTSPENYKQADVAVIDTKTDKLVKMISEKTSGFSQATRPIDPKSLFMDEKGDIYISCLGNFGMVAGHKAGILRIKKGETDFDPTYHWTITGASIEGEEKVAGFAASICYAANGKAYGYIDIPGYYKPGETGHGAIASRAVVFDLYNQKMKKIEGLDLSNGYGVLVSKYKDGLAIANASTTTKGIYYLNPQTDKINPIPMITTIGNPMAIEWFGN